MSRAARAIDGPRRAVDRIAAAALESRTTDELFARLAAVFLAAAPVAEGTVLLVPEGGLFGARAAAGEAAERAAGMRLPLPDAVAGAAPGSWAESFECVDSVPLAEGASVVGFVLRGSRSPASAEEQAALLELAEPAAAAIRQRRKRDALEERTWELRAAELTARRTAGHLGAIISSVRDGVIVRDAEGRVSLANRAAADILSLSPEELAAMPFSEFLERFRIEDAAGRPVAPLLPVALAGETVEWTERVVRAGECRSRRLRVTAAPVAGAPGEPNEAVIAFSDVTAHQRADSLLHVLSEASRVLVDATDRDEMLGRVAELCVPSFADWCGVDLLEHGAVCPAALVHAGAAAESEKDRRRTASRRPLAAGAVLRVASTCHAELYEELPEERLADIAQDAPHVARLQALRVCSAMIVPLLERGDGRGAMAFLASESGRRYDRSDLAAAEDLAHRVSVAMSNLRLFEQSRQATRAREDVLAIVSHDLRTPLSTIRLAASLLVASPSLDPSLRRHVESIERAGARMTRLIADLLDFSRVQVGHLAIDVRPEAALPLLFDLLEPHLSAAQMRGIELKREVRLPAEARMLCDRDRLQQVFGNLIGNALKFCRKGDCVVVHARPGRGDIVFAISDSGPGIPPEQLAHLFDAYWSGDVRAGMGLGLFITRGIVEAHGGRIWAENLPGNGCTVSFTIPALP